MSSSNTLDFLLNPAAAIESPIDPSLMPPGAGQRSSYTNREMAIQVDMNGKCTDGEAESENKVANLLRHFSDSPGQWCVK